MPPHPNEGWKPSFEPGNIVRATILVAALVGLVWISYQLRTLLALVLLSIVLGMALEPLQDRLVRAGLNRSQSVAAILLILLTAISILAVAIAPLLIEQTSSLIDLLPQQYEKLRLRLLRSTSQPVIFLASQLPPFGDLAGSIHLQPQLTTGALDSLIQFSGAVMGTIIAILALLLMTAFWILEWPILISQTLALLPAHNQERYERGFEFIQQTVGGFVRGQTILCLTIGVVSYIAYLIIGLPNPFALATLAGIFEAVPIVGPTMGAIPAALVAFGVNPSLLIGVAVSTSIIQGLENGFLVPRVFGQSVGVHPILILLSLTAFTSLLGIPGGLLAIPLASLVQAVIRSRVEIARSQRETTTPDESHQTLQDDLVGLQDEVEALTRSTFGPDRRNAEIGQDLNQILRDLHRLAVEPQERKE